MIVFPNAKINLGLNILRKRADGFHDIETVFLPVELSDILEFVRCGGETSFNSTGIDIPGNPGENLCVKAWQLLKNDYDIPPVDIHLHKQIPIGAGLGGGSSDGAFMLKALNEHFELKCTAEDLEKYAARLGSDCAFFIRNSPAFATGRGEQLEDVKADLSDYEVVLVNPQIHVSTAEAYSGVSPKVPEKSLKELVQLPVSLWQDNIRNDFEISVFKNHPEIEQIKDKLLESGAVYAAMSGSGSTVFGIFEKGHIPEVKELFNKNSFVSAILYSQQ